MRSALLPWPEVRFEAVAGDLREPRFWVLTSVMHMSDSLTVRYVTPGSGRKPVRWLFNGTGAKIRTFARALSTIRRMDAMPYDKTVKSERFSTASNFKVRRDMDWHSPESVMEKIISQPRWAVTKAPRSVHGPLASHCHASPR